MGIPCSCPPGHSRVGLTLKAYSRFIPDLKREKTERMGAILGR